MSQSSLSTLAQERVGPCCWRRRNCVSKYVRHPPPNRAADRTISMYTSSRALAMCFWHRWKQKPKKALVHCSMEVMRGVLRWGCNCMVKPDPVNTNAVRPLGLGHFLTANSKYSPLQIFSFIVKGTIEPSSSLASCHQREGSCPISPISSRTTSLTLTDMSFISIAPLPITGQVQGHVPVHFVTHRP